MNRTTDHPKFPVAVVLLFVALGPPLGAITLNVLLGLSLLMSVSIMDVLSFMIIGILFGLPFSFLVGGVQALVVGLIAAFYVREKGTLSYHFMTSLSLIAGVLYTINFYGQLWDRTFTDHWLIFSLWLTHLLPALVLTRVIRSKYQPVRASNHAI
ncbi:hypothetical protein [Aliidiomarina sanyensis]|uniref:Uncharacterized protein n=1 Tax=Aliidiomarina sanyensis TaxID=1249555 RepID=A0A432WB63_9GAMM|nr:hypothetical protein [Aliidiomarina sanyensis]RUO28732.1 hypothetical protein CWE11_10540 [Aliidiomarina sanyensis]